jgi:hypothetical protein
LTEKTMPPLANIQHDTPVPANMVASVPTMGSTMGRPLGGASNRNGNGGVPPAFYRSITLRYWLGAVVLGVLAWLVFFQLFHGLAGHP